MHREDWSLPETITCDDASYCIGIVEAICTEVSPGLPGNPQVRSRANMLKPELELHLGTGWLLG